MHAQLWIVSDIWAYVLHFEFCNYIETIAWNEIALQIFSSLYDYIFRIHFKGLNKNILIFFQISAKVPKLRMTTTTSTL